MAAQSKLLEAAMNCSCHSYVHPWTSSCACAASGILLAAVPSCLRTYSTVYLLALIMRMRMPNLKDIKNTIFGILQSTAFLSTNSYTFSLFVCLMRQMLGRFYFSSAAFIPSCIAGFISLCLERPARRAPLAFYVANVGIETLWNMLEVRGLVRSIPKGHVYIMGLSMTALLYLYRLGLHKTIVKDDTFRALQIVLGKSEEGPLKTPRVTTTTSSPNIPFKFSNFLAYVQLYDRLKKAKHPSCPHREGCVSYALLGGLKPFLGGIGLQVSLKLLLNIPKIIGFRMDWRKQILNRQSLQIGLALGIFSLLYKATSCTLRHGVGRDESSYAIPAGLVASIGLFQYPNSSVSLYIMWKSLQLLYNWGITQGVVPEIPHFTMYLYAFFAGLLFHAAILEARTVRPSYFKFLMNTSGNRLTRFDVRNFEGFGHKSYEQTQDVIKRLKLDMSSIYPKFPMIV